MHYFEGYQCSDCGRRIPAGSLAGECPECSGVLLGDYDLDAIRRAVAREDFFGPGEGVWRFGQLLPDYSPTLTLGEANTPLIHAGRLGDIVGIPDLYIKDESRNPTGSFKARGMAVAVSRLVYLGVKEAVMPTAGNAGMAFSAYCALAGIAAHVYVPEDTPSSMVKECELYGARVTTMAGSLSQVGVKMEEDPVVRNSVNVATFREPCRVEGKKTMAFELQGQLDGGPPQWILFPTGGGTGIVAIWKAYKEMEELGWFKGEKPKLAVVQASGCAPLVECFKRGNTTCSYWDDPRTIACGIKVPASRADKLILEALRESGGTAVSVEDDEMIEAIGEIASLVGLFPSPEGAATWAGLKKLVKEGAINSSSRVVIFNTAGGERYGFLFD